MKKKLLYFYPSYSSFIEKDLLILSDEFDVIHQRVNWTQKHKLPVLFMLQLMFLLKHIRSTSVIVIMFAGYWSILPTLVARMFKKKSFIILGGTDCSSFPHIHYGSLRKWTLKKSIEFSLTLATRLLPVHESLIQSTHTYDSRNTIKNQGYLSFFPALKTPFTVIHNGFDEHLIANVNGKKKNHFISVASVRTQTTFELKGFDIVVELAKEFPNCTFTLIGIHKKLSERYKGISNLRCYPFLPKETFEIYLVEAEFYLQLSISEGFPNALCEGMLAGCIPIGSSVNSIPEIIDSTGFILEKRDLSDTTSLIRSVLALSPHDRISLAKRASNRVKTEYPLSKRKAALYSILN